MPGTLLKSIRNCNSYDSNRINRRILRRKLITKGFFGCSLRFTTGKNSGKIDKNNFAPQNGPGARCLWALTETGLENSPILEGNKPSASVRLSHILLLENSPILEGNKPRRMLPSLLHGLS